jgi:tetratricopeptide (TPR) repeat protein
MGRTESLLYHGTFPQSRASISSRARLLAMKLLPSAVVVVLLGCLGGLAARARAADQPKWQEVHSAHFHVLTDASEKRGRQVALRMEQMRAVFGQLLMRDKLKMSVPVTVVALKSDKQFGFVAPTKQNMAKAFFVPGADRIYIVLNLSEPDPWTAVAHPLAHYFLNYNYPPTQGWFDEGMAEYFGSIRLDDKGVDIGADPELIGEWYEDAFENLTRNPNTPQSLTQLLSSPVWISMPDLFTMKHDGTGAREGNHHTLYYAQSWMVVHYLIAKNKMPEVGTYFDLVLNQKVPVEKAMVQAFDLSPAQMEEAVKAYFSSLPNLGIAMDRSKQPNVEGANADVAQPYHQASPFGPDEIGLTVNQVPDTEARAVIDDVMARIPERHDQAVQELKELTDDVKDNEAARRALAWDHIQRKEFDAAADELDRASELDPKDPWIWYYRTVLKYRQAQTTGKEMQGLANMMQDLKAVLDWYPEFAEAYNMLGVARIEGGGLISALDAQRIAISLSPRNLEYQFNLGQIYVSGKKWDQARDLFTRLKGSNDPRVAAAAKRQLEDLSTLQKYGIRPEHGGQTAQTPAGAASTPSAVASSGNDDEDSDTPPKPAPPKPGTTGPVQYLKGKLVSSDCSKPPEAVVTLLVGMKTYRLHTGDYKSLLVIGEDQFSCDWKNRLASVNYRAVGTRGGELVSIELQQ